MSITPISSASWDVINQITEIESSNNSSAVSSAIDDVGSSFTDILSSLNESQLNADNLVNQLAMGEDVDLHDVIIGLEENDVNFKVAISIRDKLVETYQEIMRMSV